MGVESELGDEMFGFGRLRMRSLRGGLFRFWGVRVYIDGFFFRMCREILNTCEEYRRGGTSLERWSCS